jgi:hypothetical protein
MHAFSFIVLGDTISLPNLRQSSLAPSKDFCGDNTQLNWELASKIHIKIIYLPQW